MLSWIRRSGSISILPFSLQQKPTGKIKLQFAPPGLLADGFGDLCRSSSVNAAHLSFHAQEQTIIHQIRIVDSIESSKHRAHQAHIQIRWCQSRPFRANREASMQNTAPTSPVQTSGNQALKSLPPRRSTKPDPVRPRSSSITRTSPKTEVACLVGQTILPSLTLYGLKHLFVGRLPKVDDRPPFSTVHS